MSEPKPRLPEFSESALKSLNDLRSRGWLVAVHNDYMLNGVPHTFWLFTKNGVCIKGEGASDAEALAEACTDLGRILRAPCFDCEQPAPAYMVKDSVWREAFPKYAEVKRALLSQYKGTSASWRTHVNLCFSCLENRLKRPLCSDDFDLAIPINSGISMGLTMGVRMSDRA